PVTTIANHTSELGGRRDHVPPALNSTVHIPICTIASTPDEVPGDQRPSSTMCSAKRTAHASTSRSPTFIPDGPPVKSTSPARETSVAIHVHAWIGAPNRRLSSGVRTTNSPVINPALPGLVIVSPAVWVR